MTGWPNVVLALLLAILSIARVSTAAIHSSIPVADDTARDQPIDGTFDLLESPTFSLTAQRNDDASFTGTTFEQRFALEFDISPVPQNAIVSAAVLRVSEVNDSILTSAGYGVDLHGYSGDGVTTLSDMVASNVVAANIANGVTDLSVDIDVTSFVQSLVNAGDDYAGFMAKFTGPHVSGFNQYYRLIRSESSAAERRPLLVISYSSPTSQIVPESKSLTIWAFLFASVFFVGRRLGGRSSIPRVGRG